MERSEYICAMPIKYIEHVPNEWFSHFGNGKKAAKTVYRNYDYMVIYLNSEGKCEVYFRTLDEVKGICVYENLEQAKKAVFDIIMECL